MPTYEYECRACRHRFERFQSMTDEPLRECPECGGALRRLIGPGSGILFKGSGSGATAARGAGLGTGCDRDRPCCGRDAPCERSPRWS
ncbi:MAG: zinc ribbon domain-containing protein [Lentisphaeria bacterium]|nr:zinc ribbon domain-containing protein [Lentisphaeria bacterium]